LAGGVTCQLIYLRTCASRSSIREAALRFDVRPSTDLKLMRRFSRNGRLAPARFFGHRRPILEPHEVLLGKAVTLTKEMLWVTIENLIYTFASEGGQSHLRKCGYKFT